MLDKIKSLFDSSEEVEGTEAKPSKNEKKPKSVTQKEALKAGTFVGKRLHTKSGELARFTDEAVAKKTIKKLGGKIFKEGKYLLIRN